MADRPGSHDFVYVHTDIPEGMTIREWRVSRAATRPAVNRHSLLVDVGTRLCGAATGIWRAAARALARPARVRVPSGRRRAPRRAAPPTSGATA